MRVIGAILLAASLFATGAVAEPLSPGRPAGVHAARGAGWNTALMLGGGAVVLVGVGIFASRASTPLSSLVIAAQPVTVPQQVINISTTATGTQ